MAQEAVECAMASGDLGVIADAFNHRGGAKSVSGDSSDRFDFEEALAGFREVDTVSGPRGSSKVWPFENSRTGIWTLLEPGSTRVWTSLEICLSLPTGRSSS
jgi:hypothetical protein